MAAGHEVRWHTCFVSKRASFDTPSRCSQGSSTVPRRKSKERISFEKGDTAVINDEELEWRFEDQQSRCAELVEPS